MTSKEVMILNEYLYKRYTEFEENVKQLQSNVRYRNIQEYDCLELIIALANQTLYNEILVDIRSILNLNKDRKRLEKH